MKTFNLVNPSWGISEIDKIIDTPLDYKTAVKNIRRFILRGISIPTVSIKDLILMN